MTICISYKIGITHSKLHKYITIIKVKTEELSDTGSMTSEDAPSTVLCAIQTGTSFIGFLSSPSSNAVPTITFSSVEP